MQNSIRRMVLVVLATACTALMLQPALALAEEDDTSIGKIENLRIIEKKVLQVTVAWTQDANSDQYQVRVLDENSEVLTEVVATKNQKTITELDAATRYFILVRGHDVETDTYGEWSNKLSVRTKNANKVKQLPPGIADKSLPEGVRMYKNAKKADAKGAMKLAMGDLYDVLVEEFTNFYNTSSQESVSIQSQRSATRSPNWVDLLSHRAREQAVQWGAESSGDPHIITFDGVLYDNQSRGVFWLVNDTKNKFSVQAIQSYVPDRLNVSYNSGIAVNAYGHTVVFNLKGDDRIMLDGKKLKLTGNRIVLWDGAMLLRGGNKFVLITENDHSLYMPLASTLNPEILIPSQATSRYSGLLGNANLNPYDDLSSTSIVEHLDEVGEEGGSSALSNFLSPGASLLEIQQTTFYDNYIEPWVASEEESYFMEEDYINYLPPADLAELDDFSLSEIQETRQSCLDAADLEEGYSRLFGCTFDSLAAGTAITELGTFLKRSEGKTEPSVWIGLE